MPCHSSRQPSKGARGECVKFVNHRVTLLMKQTGLGKDYSPFNKPRNRRLWQI